VSVVTSGPLAGAELESPFDCVYGCGLFDLRFWRVLSDRAMECPECKRLQYIQDVVDATERNTKAWLLETRRLATRNPKPDPVRAATERRMARLKARGGRGPL
jgi:hypothetical protein